MIKNLIFDFGGVIAPISREQAVEAFRQLGVADADQRLDKYHQTGIFQELEEGKITPDEFQVKLGQLCGGRTPNWEETRQAWLGYFTGLDERLLDCLKELRKRYRLMQPGVLLQGRTADGVLRQALSVLSDWSDQARPADF